MPTAVSITPKVPALQTPDSEYQFFRSNGDADSSIQPPKHPAGKPNTTKRITGNTKLGERLTVVPHVGQWLPYQAVKAAPQCAQTFR